MMRCLLIMLSLSFLFQVAAAQNCSGELSPDIFLETFGSGSNPGAELPPGTTTYTFGAIGGGNYIVTNTSGVNGTLWHNSPDHTPNDSDGYMLLFDASSETGTFFQTSFDDICSNTNYVFSCYAANIVVPSACGGDSATPNLRFVAINPNTGMELGSTNTGDISTSDSMSWGNYAISFHTAANQTSLQLKVINNSPGGCGNDLVLDDFNLRLCNPYVEQQFDLCEIPNGSVSVGTNIYSEAGMYVDLIPIPGSCNDSTVVTTITGQNTQLPPIELAFCFGDTLLLDNGMLITSSIDFTDTIDNGQGCLQYQDYHFVAQMPQVFEQSITLCNSESIEVGSSIYYQEGVYEDHLSTTIGCDSLVITRISLGTISLELEQSFFEISQGESIRLSANASSSSTGLTYSWSPASSFSCSDCPNPTFQSLEPGAYMVVVNDTISGCTISTDFSFSFLPCESTYIPNVFSPNGDGNNDYFTVFSESCIAKIKQLRIFDRWGELVYEGLDLPVNTPNAGWKGTQGKKPASSGVYVYECILESLLGEELRRVGEVLLLR